MNIAWQSSLKTLIRDPAQLLNRLDLSETLLPEAIAAAKLFPLRVTQSFVGRMRKGDPHDPLLQQVLPLGSELLKVPGFSADPLQEKSANPIPGLLHKYQGRVLLTVTGGCGIHCRYCFRRHFPYATNQIDTQWRDKLLAYISADEKIQEVILSGGDPLIANDNYLSELVRQLETIKHLKILRIHTRLPIILPERVTAELLHWLSNTRLKSVLVLHANHANEIDATVGHALTLLKQANITLLNQTVLLKNVNDSLAALSALSYALFAYDVLPYYLHMLDKVEGAAHFEVSLQTAKSLYWKLREHLPGYLVPTLVQEIPGALAKQPIV